MDKGALLFGTCLGLLVTTCLGLTQFLATLFPQSFWLSIGMELLGGFVVGGAYAFWLLQLRKSRASRASSQMTQGDEDAISAHA